MYVYVCVWVVCVLDSGEMVREWESLTVNYKYDERVQEKRKVTECSLANYGASTRSGVEITALQYQQTTRDFGQTVSIPKAKQMVRGRLVEEED